MIWLHRRTIPRVRLVHLGGRRLGLALDLALLAAAEVADDAPEVGLLDHGARLAVARPHVGEDVVAQAHHELVAGGEVHRLDRVEAGEVVGVLHRDAHRALAPLERGAQVLLQEVGGDALLDVRGHRGAGGLPVPAAEELAERLQDLLLRDAHLLDQDLRDVQLVDAGGGDRLLDVLLRDEALVDQRAELGRLVGARGAVLVVEGDAQDLRELLRRLHVPGGEGAAAPLVDQLEDAQQVLVEEDRRREDLGRAEAGVLVPARVEAQARVERRELGRVVGVLDVDRLAGEGGEARRSRRRSSGRGSPDLLARP